jgi:hypothetical protein
MSGLRRRDLLRVAGGATALFPFLRRSAEAAPPTPRLVLLMQSNGTSPGNFWPTPIAAGTASTPTSRLMSPILAPLASDPTLAARMTVVKGLFNDAGGSGNGHDQGFAGLYSGYASGGTFTDPWGTGISIDQHLRKTLTFTEPFPTLHCGVLASDTPPFKSHRRSFSYTAARQQVPTEIDPYRLYARFFSAGSLPPPGVDATAYARDRLARRRSVLDLVKADLGRLRPQLPGLERRKLESHETALRELETRLGSTLAPPGTRPAQCSNVLGPAAADQGLDVLAEDNVPTLIRLMFDFMTLALACEMSRIVTFQFGNGGEKWYFRWLGINENSHDDIAHRDHGTDPAITEKVLKMNRWYAELVKHFARSLAAIPDGDGTLLDSSLVVWGNEMATGPHGMNDIPVVLLGRAGGRLRDTGRLVDGGAQDYRRLGTSLLHVMGLPATGFGEAPNCGAIAGLGVGS